MDVVITVKSLRGTCPVYRLGDRIVLRDGYKLDLAETDAVCMHSRASVMPYCNALAHGISPDDLGLADSVGQACVQCLDPCQETGGGTVTLQIAVFPQNGR
jgi:uncharacterized repeat protein (TIGR04076 family)